MAIVLPVLVVVQELSSPATTLAVASTYMNNVKIIASFNFHMIPVSSISCDEHIGTFGSGILGNIIVLHDNVTMENEDVSSYVLLLGNYCCVKPKPVLLCTCAFILAFISPKFSDYRKARGLPRFRITSMALRMKCISLAKLLFWNQEFTFIPVNFSEGP